LRPAGSSPQFLVTFGAGFGSPAPVMGLATVAWADTDVFVVGPAMNAASRRAAQAPEAGNRVRGLNIVISL
jgi:hypothetical protein